jgi:SAM-dependent methyltransferase
MTGDEYFQSRLPPDPRRQVLWRTLCATVFSKQVRPDHCVLELGAGYGDFINNIRARRRIALDLWPGFLRYLDPAVEGHVGPVSDLSFLQDRSIDFAFASNLFEHVPQTTFSAVLDQLREKLVPGGTLNILQPNYRYAYREYFDDYTHVTVYSDISLCDFLRANRFRIEECHPRFLPLTIKSRLPVSPILIRAYLRSPIKVLGKQMLISASPCV